MALPKEEVAEEVPKMAENGTATIEDDDEEALGLDKMEKNWEKKEENMRF